MRSNSAPKPPSARPQTAERSAPKPPHTRPTSAGASRSSSGGLRRFSGADVPPCPKLGGADVVPQGSTGGDGPAALPSVPPLERRDSVGSAFASVQVEVEKRVFSVALDVGQGWNQWPTPRVPSAAEWSRQGQGGPPRPLRPNSAGLGSARSSRSNSDPTLRRPTLCPAFLSRGVCNHPDCPHIHEVCQSRRLSDAAGCRKMPWEDCGRLRPADEATCAKVPCRFLAVLGSCPHGSLCIYSHDAAATKSGRPPSLPPSARGGRPLSARVGHARRATPRVASSGSRKALVHIPSATSLASDGIGSRPDGVISLARDTLCLNP